MPGSPDGWKLAGGFRTLAAGAQSGPGDELIVNGSFENAAGSFVNNGQGVMSIPAGSTVIPGWTTVSAELIWAQNMNAFGPTTPYGNQFLDLTGFHDQPPYGGVTQTFDTTPGQNYRLVLSVGSHQENVLFRGPVSVNARVGSQSRDFHFESTDPGVQWLTVFLDFTAESLLTPLTITGTRSGGGAYLGLDHVSVRRRSVSETLRIESVTAVGGELIVVFPSSAGIRYALESRDDLSRGAWESVLDSERTGTGASLILVVPVDPAREHRFYRLVEWR